MTALITPFKEDYEVDYEGLRENVRFQIENGIHGLVPLGTTGESPVVSEEERTKIISTVIDEANGKVPVIVGSGANSTSEAINLSKHAEDLGADALLIVTPYYNKPTQEGLYLHFKAICETVDIPIIVYNIPSRTGVNLEVSTLVRLAEIENIVGIKESSGNFAQIMDIISMLGDWLTLLSGDDNITLPIISLGGKGVISVVSNLLPKQMVELVESALRGDFEKAKALHYRLLPLFKAAFIETNPIPIKAMMNLAGMRAGPCRLPLTNLQPNNLEKIKKVLAQYEEYLKK